MNVAELVEDVGVANDRPGDEVRELRDVAGEGAEAAQLQQHPAPPRQRPRPGLVAQPQHRRAGTAQEDVEEHQGAALALAALPDPHWSALSPDAPLRYWQVYADANNNGIFDVGEPTTYTDYNGYYKLKGLSAGHYIIREVRQDGWRRTSPAG